MIYLERTFCGPQFKLLSVCLVLMNLGDYCFADLLQTIAKGLFFLLWKFHNCHLNAKPSLDILQHWLIKATEKHIAVISCPSLIHYAGFGPKCCQAKQRECILFVLNRVHCWAFRAASNCTAFCGPSACIFDWNLYWALCMRYAVELFFPLKTSYF